MMSRRATAATASVMLAVILLGLYGVARGQVVIRRPIKGGGLVAQPGDPTMPAKPPTGGTAAQFSAIKLEEKSEYRKVINAARDCFLEKNWKDGVFALQGVLDSKEDFFVQVREKDANGRETLRWTSVKFEANNLLGSMEPEGFQIYEIEFGARARQLLDEAKRKGDREILADVAQRFLHTKSGIEANDLLATYFLDRGQFFMAALRFEKLLGMNPDRAKVNDLTLFKAALAYRRAGDTKNANDVMKRLEPRLRDNGGLKIGDEVIAVARLNQVLEDNTTHFEQFNPHDWPYVGGNRSRSAQANGSPAHMDDILFRRPTVQDLEEEGGALERGKQAKDRIDNTIARQQSLGNAPVMSGFFPIAAGRLLVYRSFLDIRAVYLYNGKDAQGNDAKVGKIAWRSTDFDGSLANVLEDSKLRTTLESWLTQYNNIPGFGTFVYENSLLGALSTDQRLVYAIDDLAVPAPPNLFNFMFNQQQNVSQDVKPLVMQNSLCAFNLHTGKFEWRLGVSLFDHQKNTASKDDPFADSHFLGVPMDVGGKLYVLNEKNDGANGDAELRLVCIDPNKLAGNGRPAIIGVPQKLGMVQQQYRFTHDISRRTNAVHLAYGEGILVCPTNAGEVLGVDLMSRSLAWSYPYREQAPTSVSINPQIPQPVPFPRPNQMGTMSIANWKSSPPVIQDGKVVFTAPDASSVHCINLRDGTPVWKKKQMDGDLFLAGVHQGKVLVAGRNSLRALNLKDGAQVWYLTTGDLPAGQGVASKNVYYLPLKKGEILAVDVERGSVRAHNRAKSPEPAPGNLVFYEGMVLSQTPTEIVAYPQLVAKLELASKQLEGDPLNPDKLVNRGELLLADGQVQLAVNDLQSALKRDMSAPLKARARAKLYEALTDLLQADFDQASAKYLAEYTDLSKVPENPQEQEMREARLYRIVGQGRETQGNLVEAFEMYRKFGALPVNRKDGVASLDDPMHKIPVNVWLRGRISTMMAKAKPEQKLPLETKIAEDWKIVQAKKDPDAIRSFVDMFDVPFAVGREARLQLAETIMDRNDRNAFLEAELNLQQLRGSDYFTDASIGARALAGLARLEEKKGSAEAMKLAAAYYRELRHHYPNVPVRDNKTGADLLDELATDPRFLPYLEEQGPLWSNEKIAARDMQGLSFPGLQGFMFQPEGDLTPLMKQNRLVLDPGNAANPTLRLYNLASNNIRWTQNLGTVQTNFQFFQYLYQQGQANTNFHPNARFRFYQVKGNLAVFQVGTMAYCLDMDNARVLWQHNLVENMPTNQPNMVVQQVQPDAEGNLELVIWNQFNGQRTRMPIGHVGAVQASYVALVSQKGLIVLDPLRGQMLWRKMDVPANARVFGDDQYIFLVEGTDGGGAGRAMRAIDGTTLDVPDFGAVYQNRIRILGRKILAGTAGQANFTLRLYDIVTGKDLWSKTFDPRSVVMHTEDPSLTGILEPDGKLTALDVDSGRVLLQTSVLQGKATTDDLKNLKEPLLLQDRDRYYVALNHPTDATQVAGGIVSNNFGNGLRCMIVNGWMMAFYREDGQHKKGAETLNHKKGELAWHTHKKIDNQMLVLEQFENLPVLLFSSRYNELIKGGAAGNRWVSHTQSLNRSTGKFIYLPSGPTASNSQAQFYTFNIDLKGGTINLIGHNNSIQHYVDDGRKPSTPSGGGVVPGNAGPGTPGVGMVPPNIGINPGFRAPIIIRNGVQIQPALPVAPPQIEVEKR